METLELNNKKAFVTGGCSGIGKAISEALIANGANVVIMDYADEERRLVVKKELGDKCEVVFGDVTSEENVKKVIDFTVEKYGTLDIAVNCAGLNDLGNIWELDADSWDHTVKICLYGTFYTIKNASSKMIDLGVKGVIINISSLNSTVPYYQYAGYCSSKAAVDMLTRVASLDLGVHGIRVVAVAPGWIDTPLTNALIESAKDIILEETPLGRVGDPSDVANAVVYLASDKASYITGTVLTIDGGQENKAYPDFLKLFGMR